MIDYEYYRKRRWHKRRDTRHAWAWLAAWAVLSCTIAYAFIHRF